MATISINTITTSSSWLFKLILLTAAIVTISLHHVAEADTKVLSSSSLNIEGSPAKRAEIISLDNDNNLQINGLYQEQFVIPNDSGHVLKSTIYYVADKNGYQAKYTLVKEPYYVVQHLSASSLKTLAG